MLRVRGLTKSFGGATVLPGVDLEVEAGEVVALVGPNGSGKTTLLRCVVGAEAADDGEVVLRGRPLDTRDAQVRADLCALLDDTAWFFDLTVAEHLDLLARADSVDDADEVIGHALDELGLAGVADQVPATLSSGQRQRLSLAVAVVRPWELLVVDEPEQRLDEAGRAWLGDWMVDQASLGRSVLMACHDADLVARSGARPVAVGSW